MPATKPEIKFALNFPQGLILMTNTGGAYFMPHTGTDAFSVYGERKELFGKNAITVSENRDTGAGGYSIVYEFGNNNALADARLVKKGETFRGTLVDDKIITALNDAVAQDKIKLYTHQDTQPPKVYNVARFADGRLLVQMHDWQLYIGTPGNFTKVDAEGTVQGGGSRYYKLKNGGEIALPYGYGGPNGEIPTFDGEEMNWIKIQSDDPARIGLVFPEGIKHLDPFSPQLAAAKPAEPKRPAAKPGL